MSYKYILIFLAKRMLNIYKEIKTFYTNKINLSPVLRQIRTISRAKMLKNPNGMKTPNILIYTGQNKNSHTKYTQMKTLIEHCVNQEAYTIYQLKNDMLKATPWQKNTTLLILASDTTTSADEETTSVFLEFAKTNSNVLSFRSAIEDRFLELETSKSADNLVQISYKDWNGVHLISSGKYFNRSHTFAQSEVEFLGSNHETGECFIALLSLENKIVLNQVCIDEDCAGANIDSSQFNLLKRSNSSRLEIVRDMLSLLNIDCSAGSSPNLTPSYLMTFTEDVKSLFVGSFLRKISNNCLKSKGITLSFPKLETTELEVTEFSLPVFLEHKNSEFAYFDSDIYWSCLKTKVLGRVLLYADVIPTTMSVLDGFLFSAPEQIGVVAIAGRQTAGKGRGGNAWLSPLGCAMFSAHIRVDLDSSLGRKVTFLQHIVSLAVVRSLLTLSECEGLPLKLKWPNDIYYGRSMKLGGVIVNSSMMGSTIHAVVGCGVNVSNSNPTICINDIIQNYNRSHDKSIPPCTTEQMIARTLTQIEILTNMFQENPESFCDLYYEHWMHGGDVVKVESLDYSEVMVHGLDDFGFLQVKQNNGQLVSLQPDGNSFDIMHNLIAVKRTYSS